MAYTDTLDLTYKEPIQWFKPEYNPFNLDLYTQEMIQIEEDLVKEAQIKPWTSEEMDIYTNTCTESNGSSSTSNSSQEMSFESQTTMSGQSDKDPPSIIHALYEQCRHRGINIPNPQSNNDNTTSYPYTTIPTFKDMEKFWDDVGNTFSDRTTPPDLLEECEILGITGHPMRNMDWLKDMLHRTTQELEYQTSIIIKEHNTNLSNESDQEQFPPTINSTPPTDLPNRQSPMHTVNSKDPIPIEKDFIHLFYETCFIEGVDVNNPDSYFNQYNRYPYKIPPSPDDLLAFIYDISKAYDQWTYPEDLQEVFRNYEIYEEPWSNNKWKNATEKYLKTTGSRGLPPNQQQEEQNEPMDVTYHQPTQETQEPWQVHLSLNAEKGIEPMIPTLGRTLSEAL
jgi:hypothetical protein